MFPILAAIVATEDAHGERRWRGFAIIRAHGPN
jgi:hypothetical protein